MLRPLLALFERSLREQSRMKSTFVARTAIGLLLLIIIGMNERNFVNRPAPGQTVLAILVWVNFFAITIFGLGTFASAITEEKEEGTLGLMLMTQLNPLAILLGKSTARLFDGLMLLAVQVPFTMLCVTLGGVSPDQILRCYAILAAFLFFLCNVALLWSVVFRRTSRAGSMTTLTGVLLYIVPWFFIPFMYMSRFTGKGTSPVWYEQFLQWTLSINPCFDLAKTTVPRGTFPFAADSIRASVVGGLICFALAWLLFGPCCGNTEEAAPRKAQKAGKGPRRRFAVPRPGRRAIAWKDFHFLGGGFSGLMVRGLVYLTLVGGFSWWMATVQRGSFRWEQFGYVLMTFGIIAFSVEVGVAGARVFGVERKRRTLGSLYTLPIGTSQLIWQKVLGALPGFIPSVGIFIAGIVMIDRSQTYPSDKGWRFLLDDESALFVAEYIFFAVLVLYLSLRMRRAGLATAIGGMFLANFFVGGVFRGFSGPDGILFTTAMFGLLTVVVAALIPGRLEHAAAEE